MTQIERAEEKCQRKIIISPFGKTHNALHLREAAIECYAPQWFVRRFPRYPYSTDEMLEGLGVWCVKTLKSISKPLWTEKEETSSMRAISIFWNESSRHGLDDT